MDWTEEEFAILSQRLLNLDMAYDIFKINRNEFLIRRNETILAKYDCSNEKLITYGKNVISYFK